MKYIIPLLIAVFIITGCATTSAPVSLQPVDSSAIKAIGYDSASQTLYVQLGSTGDTYTYDNVPANIYDDFLASKSKGHFYTQNVKGKFPANKK